MNFTHLKYAVTVAKYGSISRAAQELFVSQPYMSNTIKKMEDELGYQIFDRTRKGITLTSEGKEFITSACRILLELDKIEQISPSKADKPLRLSVYYSTYIVNQFFKFRDMSPTKLPDKLRETGITKVFDSILRGESTLGIVFYASAKREYYLHMAAEYNCICQDLFTPFPLYVIVSKNHKLAAHTSISIKELNKYPYVIYDDSASLRYMKFLGINDTSKLLQVSDRGSYFDAVKTAGYISVSTIADSSVQKDCVFIPINDKKLYLNSSYVTARNYQLSKREHDFLNFLRKNFVSATDNSVLSKFTN